MAQYRENLLLDEAPFPSRLRAHGVSVWGSDDIKQYMQERYAAQRVGFLHRISPEFPFLPALVIAIGIGVAAYAVPIIDRDIATLVGLFTFIYLVLAHVRQKFDWKTNRLGPATMTYMRDFNDKYPLPSAIALCVTRIRQVEPRARFEVSFLGEDPVLWVRLSFSEGSARYAVAVWDEHKRGGITIIPPPR